MHIIGDGSVNIRNRIFQQMHFQVVPVKTRHVENVVDVARQTIGRNHQPIHQLLLVALQPARKLVSDNVKIAADNGDRSAQLVRRKSDEIQILLLWQVVICLVYQENDRLPCRRLFIRSDDIINLRLFSKTRTSSDSTPAPFGLDVMMRRLFQPFIKRLLIQKIQRQTIFAIDIASATTDEAPADFLKSIEDDLNTPGAMATLFALSSEIERAMTAGDHKAVGIAKAELMACGRILGVLLASPDSWFEGGADDALKAEVDGLLAERVTARAEKNWAEADRIRDRLTALKVVVMDGPTGATWRLKE